MTPDFCKGCKNLNEHGGCYHYSQCRKWREWFKAEWDRIRIAAALLKMKEEEKDDQGATKNL